MLTINVLDVFFHLEYFLSCKNFCKDENKKNFFQNNICFNEKLMEPPFSECLALLKNQETVIVTHLF